MNVQLTLWIFIPFSMESYITDLGKHIIRLAELYKEHASPDLA